MNNFELLFGVKFCRATHGCKFFLLYLRAENEAHIINVSSMLGFATLPGQTYYCASKFSIRSFNDSLYE